MVGRLLLSKGKIRGEGKRRVSTNDGEPTRLRGQTEGGMILQQEMLVSEVVSRKKSEEF